MRLEEPAIEAGYTIMPNTPPQSSEETNMRWFPSLFRDHPVRSDHRFLFDRILHYQKRLELSATYYPARNITPRGELPLPQTQKRPPTTIKEHKTHTEPITKAESRNATNQQELRNHVVLS